MTDDITKAFHSTARLQRSSIFTSCDLDPITAPENANTAAPGWVGSAWRSGGTLLVGINPGGGGDAYKGNPTDYRLYNLIRAFRDSPPVDLADALRAMSDAWMAIQATHNIRRVIDAVLEAVGEGASASAFINIVPFRTRNDAPPRRADLIRAWAAASGPQVRALSPGRIVALGRKAYDALLEVGADQRHDVILIKRSIGDSTITPEAREVLAKLRGEGAGLPAVSRAEATVHRTRATPHMPPSGKKSLALTSASSSHPLAAPEGIKSPAARAAHLHLLEAAARMNLIIEPHSSAITAVKLLDRQGRYLFSWIVNAHHLLFYIRKPALKIAPALLARSQESLAGVKVNPAGEVTVRLETTSDAELLTEWLFDRQTWLDNDPSVIRDGVAARATLRGD